MADLAGGSAAPVPTVQVARVVTVVFVVTQVAATIAPRGALGLVAVVWSLVLFAGGSVAFLWAFLIAAGRSRDDDVTIAGVIWLTNAAPPVVARALRGVLVAQVVVALVTAAVRPFSAVAFGILAPMAGLGALAWYGARHGEFAPAQAPRPAGTERPAGKTRTAGAERAGDRPKADAAEPPAPTPDPGTDRNARPPSDRDDPDDFDQLFRRRRRRRPD